MTAIIMLTAVVAFIVYIAYLMRKEKLARAKAYADRQAELDAWRETAIKDKTLFTRYDRKTVEMIIKGQDPSLNRKQRRNQAKAYGKNFVERAKRGLE